MGDVDQPVEPWRRRALGRAGHRGAAQPAEGDLVNVGHNLDGLAQDEEDRDGNEDHAEVGLASLPARLLGIDFTVLKINGIQFEAKIHFSTVCFLLKLLLTLRKQLLGRCSEKKVLNRNFAVLELSD